MQPFLVPSIPIVYTFEVVVRPIEALLECEDTDKVSMAPSDPPHVCIAFPEHVILHSTDTEPENV